MQDHFGFLKYKVRNNLACGYHRRAYKFWHFKMLLRILPNNFSPTLSRFLYKQRDKQVTCTGLHQVGRYNQICIHCNSFYSHKILLFVYLFVYLGVPDTDIFWFYSLTIISNLKLSKQCKVIVWLKILHMRLSQSMFIDCSILLVVLHDIFKLFQIVRKLLFIYKEIIYYTYKIAIYLYIALSIPIISYVSYYIMCLCFS